MRDAARLLAMEAEVLPGLLAGIEPAAFDRPTVCTGWSVRDVLAHCGAALSDLAAGTLGGFTPEDNQRAVDERVSWPLQAVMDELFGAYAGAVRRIDELEGLVDGIGLGEWIHGGDVREPLGLPDPYASVGSDVALDLISARSVERRSPAIDLVVDGAARPFGVGEVVGSLTAGTATFVRLVSGRGPDPTRYRLEGVDATALTLFS